MLHRISHHCWVVDVLGRCHQLLAKSFLSFCKKFWLLVLVCITKGVVSVEVLSVYLHLFVMGNLKGCKGDLSGLIIKGVVSLTS